MILPQPSKIPFNGFENLSMSELPISHQMRRQLPTSMGTSYCFQTTVFRADGHAHSMPLAPWFFPIREADMRQLVASREPGSIVPPSCLKYLLLPTELRPVVF